MTLPGVGVGVGVESPDGRFIYYTKTFYNGVGIVPGLWRLPVEGGYETLVGRGAAVRAWAVVEGGIFFVKFPDTVGANLYFVKPPAKGAKAHPALEYFSFSTGRVTQIVAFDKEPFPDPAGLSISPDKHWALFNAEPNGGERDIVLVDNLR